MQITNESVALSKVVVLTGIPRRSLIRAKKSGIFDAHLNQQKSRIFTDEEEALLRDYLATCSAMFYGLGIRHMSGQEVGIWICHATWKGTPCQLDTEQGCWIRLASRIFEENPSVSTNGRSHVYWPRSRIQQNFSREVLRQHGRRVSKYGHFEPTNIWNLQLVTEMMNLMSITHRLKKKYKPETSCVPMATSSLCRFLVQWKKRKELTSLRRLCIWWKKQPTGTFLHRLKTCFVFPDVEDCAQVKMTDIICRLPQPNYGTIGRTKRMISFPLDLSAHHIP